MAPRRVDWVPIIALGTIVLLAIASLWVVPAFMAALKHEDCIGQGSTDC